MSGRRLAPVEIRQIRQLGAAGVSALAVATRFEVTTNTVHAIWRLSDAELVRRLGPGAGQRSAYSAAFRRRQRRHGLKAAGGAVASVRPQGIRAVPFSEEWWAENNANFVRAMRWAHPEREVGKGGLADSSTRLSAIRDRTDEGPSP